MLDDADLMELDDDDVMPLDDEPAPEPASGLRPITPPAADLPSITPPPASPEMPPPSAVMPPPSAEPAMADTMPPPGGEPPADAPMPPPTPAPPAAEVPAFAAAAEASPPKFAALPTMELRKTLIDAMRQGKLTLADLEAVGADTEE